MDCVSRHVGHSSDSHTLCLSHFCSPFALHLLWFLFHVQQVEQMTSWLKSLEASTLLFTVFQLRDIRRKKKRWCQTVTRKAKRLDEHDADKMK